MQLDFSRVRAESRHTLGAILVGGLFVLILLLTLRGSAVADVHPIVIDGDFSDWGGIAPVSTDPSGDGGGSGVDFGTLKIADDDRHLFLFLDFGTLTPLDEQNDLVLYLDTDANASTGVPIAGIGAELEWRFGSRNGDFRPLTGGVIPIFHNAIRFHSSPTVAGVAHEIAIGRDTLPNGSEPLFTATTIRLVVREESPGGDQIPDASGGVSYTFDVGGPVPIGEIPIARELATDLRLVTWNVLNDTPWNAGEAPRFGRTLAAIDPDIVCFEEIYDHDPPEVTTLVSSWVAPDPGGTWQGVRTHDCHLVSRFPILGSWSIGNNLAVRVDATARIGSEVFVVVAHLPCCTNEAGRQSEADEILEFIRQAIAPGGVVTLLPDTPILITGDLNLVLGPGPRDSLQTGDIDDNATHGPDFDPDWDGTPLYDVLPRLSGVRLGYTWRNDSSSFWPGHLDYWLVSDFVVEVAHSFVLYSDEMSAAARAAAGLQIDDSTRSDHVPFVLDLRPVGPTAPGFARSDCNGDGGFDISDAIAVLGALFGGPALACVDSCDGNDDGIFDLADAIFILAHRFSGGPDPSAPYPACGVDPTADGVSCATPPGC
mgnify:CR=1 FL=1